MRLVSKREHIATVAAALQAATRDHPLPVVRLLLSVDRSRDTPADAVQTVQLALHFPGIGTTPLPPSPPFPSPPLALC